MLFTVEHSLSIDKEVSEKSESLKYIWRLNPESSSSTDPIVTMVQTKFESMVLQQSDTFKIV